MPEPTLLQYAASESSANQYYFSGIFVPDAFLTLQHDGKRYGIVSPLEISRVKRDSRLDTVLSLEEFVERGKKAFSDELKAGQRPGSHHVIRMVAQDLGISEVTVPEDFPAGLAFRLMEAGIKVSPKAEPFFPERIAKSDEEAEAIRSANEASAAGFREAEKVLRQAEIKGQRLMLYGRTLTSERLREAIDVACMQAGAVATHTIVAGGEQACDPHETGHGPLRPHELIIIDIFPRSKASGYFGDMTRTYVKGAPTPEQQALVATVKEAHERCLAAVKTGVEAGDTHKAAADFFDEKGYATDKQGDPPTGFFHSTGHGLGLEIHELPRLYLNQGKLVENTVVTVEPGLYYPGLGGCRIEDVVRVKADGPEMLSDHHYRWEIE